MENTNFFRSSLMILLFCFGFTGAWGQYTVSFDGANDGTHDSQYGFTNHNLNGITWSGTQAIIPITPLAGDWRIGTRSLRLRGYAESHFTMTQNKPDGIGTVTFQYRRYGTDTQQSWKVEYSTNNGSSWTQLGSNFTASSNDNVATFSETLNMANARIRIVCNGSGSSNRRLNIDNLILTDFSSCTDPVINTQPSDQTVIEGQTATFNVVASGTSLTYQWQMRASSAGNFNDIPGATDASYTTPESSIAMSNSQYRVIVSSGACSTTSNAATLIVNENITATDLQNGSATGIVGEYFEYEIVNNGGAPDFYEFSALPNGLFSDDITGIIFGTPLQAGIFNVTVSGENVQNEGAPSIAEIEIVITLPPSMITVTPTVIPAFNATTGETDAKNVTINGVNLENEITVTLSDDTHFAVSVTSFPETNGNAGGILTITYTPVTVGTHNVILTLSSTDAEEVILNLSGTATLGVPVATSASNITEDGFTANWDAVPGADSYEIDVYTIEGSVLEILNEEFIWADGIGGNDGQWSNINPPNVNMTTELPNWNGNSVRKSFQCIQMGTGSSQGYVTTPALGFTGNGTLTFRAGAWNGGSEQTTLRLEIAGGGSLEMSQVTMVKGAFTNYEVQISNATPDTKITFKGWATSNSRFFLDDVVIIGGNETINHILQNENVGNVTSYEVTDLDPETTYYYVVRAIAGSATTANSNEIEVITTAVPAGAIWENGEWANAIYPDIETDVIIRDVLFVGSDYPSFEAQSLTIVNGAGAIYIEEEASVTVSGIIDNENSASEFIVDNGGNLIQLTDAPNYGEITVYQNSQSMVRNDNTLWSSPVSGQGIRAFSPETLYNRFWTYDEANTTYLQLFNADSDADINFAEGAGYGIRVRDTLPIGQSEIKVGEFSGVPHNGTITVPVTLNGNGYNIAGNPYPSNIFVQGENGFFSTNSNVGAIYFWTHEYPVGSSEYGNNYATFSLAGGNQGDLEYISKGQGFIVKVSAPGNVVFNNSMRIGDATEFYRQQELERHRIWISLSDEEQKLSQLLVAYMPGATEGFDHQIDAKFLGNGSAQLNNLVEGEGYAIQGREMPFKTTDIVPLGFHSTKTGNYIISLENFDGLFTEGDVIIYLKDNELNLTHNLMESAYAFESEAGEFNGRFEVVYETEDTMGAADLTANTVQIYKHEENIVMDSKVSKILSVEVYDMNGRNIHHNMQVNANTYRIASSSFGKQVLVVRIQTEKGEIVTKKIIN